MSVWYDGKEDEKTRGCVVRDWERNGYDDSDFYATVYRPETGTFDEVMYATTRSWTYNNGCKIDATPEVLEKWTAFNNRLDAERRAKKAAEKARTVEPGKTVRSLTTRGKAAGKVGKVFWVGRSKFGYNVFNAGFRTVAGETVFAPLGRLEVVLEK